MSEETKKSKLKALLATNKGVVVMVCGLLLFTSAAAALYTATTNGGNVRATYYNNRNLSGSGKATTVSKVDFNWGTGSPLSGIKADNWSARYEADLYAPQKGTYRIYTDSDDGVNVWINDELIVSSWTGHKLQRDSGSVFLHANKAHKLRVEYFDGDKGAQLKLSWSLNDGFGERVIPSSAFKKGSKTATPVKSTKQNAPVKETKQSTPVTPKKESTPVTPNKQSSSTPAAGGAIDQGLKSKPTASNTGVKRGVKLRKSGTIKTSKAGQVIQNVEVSGQIMVNHPNVTIRNVRVNNYSSNETGYGISGSNNGKNTKIENVEVNMKGRGAAAIATRDGTVLRNSKLTGHGDGIKIWHNSLYEHNYIVMARKPGSKLHLDGMQSEGKSNFTVRYNYVYTPANKGGNIAIFTQSYVSGKDRPVKNIKIYNNWVLGGNTSIMTENDKKGKGKRNYYSNTAVYNNRFIRGNSSTKRYPLNYILQGNVKTYGHVWDDNGKKAPASGR